MSSSPRRDKPLKPALLEALGGIPNWLDRVRACRDCGADIRLITAVDTALTRRVVVVDATPMYNGYVRLYLRDRRASYRPDRRPDGKPALSDPYLSFQTHRCDEHLEAKR